MIDEADSELSYSCPVCDSTDAFQYDIRARDATQPVKEPLENLTVGAEIARVTGGQTSDAASP